MVVVTIYRALVCLWTVELVPTKAPTITNRQVDDGIVNRVRVDVLASVLIGIPA